ncbi:hypothetical protein QR680_005235 [Steinernema hermaphroditum]|uniref:mRNA-capping enzyme n=1 Tax=Steinernema hermaphroditum TaxID=289476 RepID=A0AA39LVA0_9BILA|nr:hypothetical protein QR680_005235 [Steinernema hermaphroditum]
MGRRNDTVGGVKVEASNGELRDQQFHYECTLVCNSFLRRGFCLNDIFASYSVTMDDDDLFSDPSGPTPRKAEQGFPDRWLYCPPMGKVIAKTFLPFKTPLCRLYDYQFSDPKYRFHVDDVFSAKLEGAHPGAKIGLWVDLTKTSRYYSKKEVQRKDCKYVKMPLAGHGQSPTEDETIRFIGVVRDFLDENPNEVVAVHCTHGFNRTGFLIAAYLVEVMDNSVEYAVMEFAKHRHGGIYKQDYVNDLVDRLDGEPMEAAPRPSWDSNSHSEVAAAAFDNDHNQNEENDDRDENEEGKANEPKFMDGLIPGVSYVSDPTMRSILQNKIKEMCGYGRDGFPGSQPVSLERSPENNNTKLLEEGYMVSWKADGMRYLVLIHGEGEVFAFDRDNNVFQLPISFPHRKEERHVSDTLCDCEMIIDNNKLPDGTVETRPRLLIYDVISYEGQEVGKCDFERRLDCIQRELIGPRIEAMKAGKLRREDEPMSVRRKDFWDIGAVPKFFEPKFTSTVGHEIDGLIFQPRKKPYLSGRCDFVLKWKPPSHNSIDFKLQIRKVTKEGELPQHIGYLYVQHRAEPIAEMKATRSLLPYDNKIIECTYKDGKWCFMRERTDKSLPNSFNTANAVWNTMMHPIHQQDLANYCRKIGEMERKFAQKRHHDGQNGHPDGKRERRE